MEPGNADEQMIRAVIKTRVIRPPKQALSTFGTTTIQYYLLTLPSYAMDAGLETVVRVGSVVADRPRIVTPYYLSRLEGFSGEATRYFQKLVEEHGTNAPGIFYTCRNELKNTEIVSGGLEETACKINEDIDRSGDQMSAVICGDDALWDVSVMKFIFEMTSASLAHNAAELGSRGLLSIREGIPAQTTLHIEQMFQRLHARTIDPRELQKELENWGLFEAYQDRFLAAFRRC
ncbi:MAG: hypothetical protein FWF18_01510 [Dehalococcoidia bacterium]|nr:hypothetical protein [Dehalococcoidia bacterium]